MIASFFSSALALAFAVVLALVYRRRQSDETYGVRVDTNTLPGTAGQLTNTVDPDGGALLPFDEFVAHHGAALIGTRLWDGFGKWPMYSKFFDNQQALPFHFHHRDEDAARVGKLGKPEAYYFSPHMNNHLGDHPVSFFGFQKGLSINPPSARRGRAR